VTFPNGKTLSHETSSSLDETGRTALTLHVPAAEFFYAIGPSRGGPMVETRRFAGTPGRSIRGDDLRASGKSRRTSDRTEAERGSVTRLRAPFDANATRSERRPRPAVEKVVEQEDGIGDVDAAIGVHIEQDTVAALVDARACARKG